MELPDLHVLHDLPDRHPALPIDVPFTTAQAAGVGVGRDVLTRLVRSGLLRRVVDGVYVDAAVPDSTLTRTRAVSLVIPETAVVCDESAAWVHGVDLDPPQAHVVAPPVSVFQLPGNTRVRKDGCAGGERTLLPRDVIVVDGVRVLSPLRLACDLGRLRSRDQGLGAMDALARKAGFVAADVVRETVRFRGMRGVVQLRDLGPRVDGRAMSLLESWTRLRCDDGGLPALTPQVEVRRGGQPWGELAMLDLANEQLRFAVEYDGEDWHTSDEQRAQDRRRRGWLTREESWGIVVLTRRHVPTHDRAVTVDAVRRALERHLAGQPCEPD
ncbi:type IV toxin-antitoxin system AbiEi family antitoxin domain-containing protein [Nocardioides sp. W7]|uniref:type IV toxin-antitoxin system AbiEi family antitoxin domain-containing protein n=1 Tax=Nocardioides sp. W7 TaxID=2931390 RepID=UPI001FCFD9AB|nr:type IV toxin-antitoxin system AbiEi family antitoxin domain-containing protein [Nocardioides sp. W7]